MKIITPLSPDAERIAQEFKDFTYIVSHDLNSPVRGMVEFSRLLLLEHNDVLNDEGKQYLSLIVESGEKLQTMLVGLLEFSRLNTLAKKRIPKTAEEVQAIVNNCLLPLNEKKAKTKASLTVEPLPALSIDADQFQQLVHALLDNALTYHRPGVPLNIRMTTIPHEHEVEFTVQDNGIGIDPQFFNRVFQPFQRLHTPEEYPGIGMGLAIAKKIVERHEGKIWIEPSPGHGVSIKFTISNPA